MNDLDTSTALTERARTLAASVLGTSRRGVLCGAFGVSAAAVLTACGAGGDTADGGDKDSGAEDKTADDGGGESDSGTALAKEADVPVGGGKVVDDVVVVQPEKGEFKAFNRACTHKGTMIEAPEDGVMTCPAHGSKFNVDGSVAGGPATNALAEVKVTVKDGEIFRA